MLTLYFNNDMEHPVMVSHVTYNIAYERPGNTDRNEYLNGALAQGEGFGISVSSLNHFENVAIETVLARKNDESAREIIFSAPMHLASIDSYIGAENEHANFYMQYFEPVHENVVEE